MASAAAIFFAFLWLQDAQKRTLCIDYGLNCPVCSPGHHQVLYHSPWLDEDQNQLKNDEAATLKWLQFRSGSGQLGV